MFFCQHPQTPDWSGPDCKFEVSENNILFICSLVLTDSLGKGWLTFLNITDHYIGHGNESGTGTKQMKAEFAKTSAQF